jgi:hypothetical protein
MEFAKSMAHSHQRQVTELKEKLEVAVRKGRELKEANKNLGVGNC